MKKNNEIPINKLNIAKRLLELGNPIIRLGNNKHNKSLPIYYFNGTEKFFRDLNWIKDKG